MADEPTPPPTGPFIPEDVPYFSATGLQLGPSRWTLQLVLISPLTIASGRDRAEAVVSMPWTLAKALYLGLAESIKGYESVEGEIMLPKSYVEAMAASKAEEEVATKTGG